MRLLFSESLALAALGGAGGVVVSFLAVDGLHAVLPRTIPRVDAISIDGWALGFALGASVLSALLFGMVPAMLASRTDLASGVKQGGYATLAPRKERIRDAFIVGQIALGLVLANGAGLLVQSYAKVRRQEYGFRSEGVLTLALAPAGPRYEDEGARQRYFEEVEARVGALPGVTHVGHVSKLAPSGGSNGNALVANDSATAAVGAVINRTFAESVWPDEDPLGKRFSFSDDPPEWITVVGVVGDVRQWGPERRPIAEAYLPLSRGWSGGGYVVARVAGDPSALGADMRRAVLAVDPTQPPSDLRAMADRVESAFAQRRFYTTLIGLFAVAALFLAAAGVYGTVSYFVARRTRELGIRIALGAAGTGIVGLVVRRGVRLAILGVGLGLLGVWTSTSVIEGLVYGIDALDTITLTGGCLTLAAVAVAASALPELRAVRVPPVLALRSE